MTFIHNWYSLLLSGFVQAANLENLTYSNVVTRDQAYLFGPSHFSIVVIIAVKILIFKLVQKKLISIIWFELHQWTFSLSVQDFN